MKKLVIITIFTFLFFSCNFRANLFVNNQQATIDALHGYLADGVILDDQRPMADILSEQEVLVKAANIAYNQGVLDPSYYLYEREPALLTAKIEAPILLHSPCGEPRGYMLHAVDEDGASLMEAFVKSEENVEVENFVSTLFEPLPSGREGEYDNLYYITKREVNQYTQRRFPDKKIKNEPVAVTNLFLEDRPHSNSQIFWYFQVEDQSRSVTSVIDEYIIDALVLGNIPSKESGRSLISSAYRGSPHLGGYRMAKLSRPLNFQYFTRNSSRSVFENSVNTALLEPMGFTGVPLE